MDINDIKVGDIVKMINGAIYTVSRIHDDQITVESANSAFFQSSYVEKRLNKYHVGDRVILIKDPYFEGTIIKVEEYDYLTAQIVYDIKMDDDVPRSFYAFEEDIIAMDEKKVNFEVGDYVRIDSEKIGPCDNLAQYCGHLGIIVGPGYNKDYWNIYFFTLKRMYIVGEKYLVKSENEYEVKVKTKEEISLKESYKTYNSEKWTPLKELYKRYIEHDDVAIKSALNFLYGCSMEMDKLPKIKKVIFNGPATIVLWADGDKTVVHCGEGDTMDKEKGLAMAICKKALGKSKTHYDYYNVFKKWIKEEKK